MHTAPVPALLFCVDAGGSGCRGRLVEGAAASVLAEATDGPCNPATDLRQGAASLAGLWASCAGRAGRDLESLAGVTLALGGAGLSVPAVRAQFLASCPAFGRSVVMSDGYAALIGAGGGRPCGLLTVGTGVAGHRLRPDGTSLLRDGWGWVGGDRGSGAWIGQRALRHTLAAEDGVVARDALGEAVMGVLQPGPEGLAARLVGMGPDRLAALAPVVLGCAAAAARAIVGRAIEHLAALTEVLALGAGEPLFLAGGLAAALRPALAERLGVDVRAPAADACAGALLVATGAAPAEAQA